MIDIEKKIEEWSSPPFDEDTIEEIRKLVRNKKEKELFDRFYRNLEFGTGGLRGLIGAGSNRMNIYTVGMATQGLANYIAVNGSPKSGVVIARDSRNMSDQFAEETASILAGNGIPVYYFRDIMPIPLASFAVRHLGAGAAVMITASHNPPEYNGYKVFWDDGGQVVPPHDIGIIAEVEKIQSIESLQRRDFHDALGDGTIRYIEDDVIDAYYGLLAGAMAGSSDPGNISILYTPLHGTGYKMVPKMLKRLGYRNIHVVEKQSVPDGNFPTVESPNPEEREAMKMAIEEADRIGADIIMATDPDADRMGIGYRDSGGTYSLLNGNQIGSMLEYYILTRKKEKDAIPHNGVVVKTVVTTGLQDEIAKGFNVRTEDVLTGFKWIAAKMKEYETSGSAEFLFGGEESFGYLPVNFVRDKDAVSSCCFFAEMASWLAKQGSSLSKFLDEIYCRYSLYLEDLHSITKKGAEGKEAIAGIMKGLRESTPGTLGGIRVVSVKDLLNMKERDITTGGDVPVTGLPPSNVLQLRLEDGSVVTVRPSGTEPKIKLYFSVRTAVNEETLDEGKRALREKLESIKKELLELIE